ncbi:GntP family permease [Cytobacillus sp. FSL W7-1323]|uniref:Gluconate transporter n=1 Tax=Cytobacillus kochii TaxID=859143 RepID=A0A248TID9_9BACI|nr:MULTISPECIES: GntP family permease [Cytobacillus]ASV67850.1 gluconate transporter [Cytobacillus kochii]MDQ0185934.1 GntP family gluconate:H+ symporter [Cytobacillus kochii]MEA1853896.1 GntP family permease [Cytobacillus sp. OWB-43]
MLFFIIAIGVLIIVLATTKFKIHPFMSLLIGALFVGFASGMPFDLIVESINSGFGGVMTSIGLVIVFGTIIGVILEKAGAAYRMAEVVLRIVGPKRPQLAMSIIGFIVSIPVFCDSGFIILNSLRQALAKRAKVTMASMSVALATGLYATHTLVPPTPGPIAAAGNIGAEAYLGTVILIGFIVAIPAAAIGYLWSVKVATKIEVPEDRNTEEFDYDKVVASFGKMPSTFQAFFPIILPILLIGLGSIVAVLGYEGWFAQFIGFLGTPVIALFIGILAALPLLPQFNEETLTNWVGKGLLDAAPVLLITGAGGVFGTVIKNSGVADIIQGWDISDMFTGALFLIIPFLIAAALKSAQGSSTTALVLTSSLIAPMLPVVGIEGAVPLALVVMAIGAGAMTVSHVNDSYFWVVTQFTGMKVTDAYKAQTMATLLQGLVSIIVAMILWVILV